MTFGRSSLDRWPLDPASVYLNHGTVGVTPLRVLEAQRGIRDEIERHPSGFLLRDSGSVAFAESRIDRPRLRAAADEVAAFVGARGDDLAFVDNVTTGANAVLRSFPLRAGDEILVTDLGYEAVAKAAGFVARQHGASVRTVAAPWPFDPSSLARAVVDAAGPSTRLAILDHITSGTALILPVAEMARELRRKGVAVLVDGAHVPGALALDIPALGVDWYVGNLHKWGWTPRSSGILWVAPDRQAEIHPTSISWGLGEGFLREFDWVGTRDLSGYLSAVSALALMREWGVEAIRDYNHTLVWNGAHRLAERWGTSFDVAEAHVGVMATVPAPASLGTTTADAQRLRSTLYFDEGIEVHVHAWRGRVWIRISGQIYNDMSDIDRLADAVAKWRN